MKNWRPKTEPDIQNVLWPRVKDKLRSWNVLGIEEVYIGANRTDFACKKVVGGEELTVFIEIKKADPDGLIASIENQLLEQYMQLGGVDFGIHLTFWFKDGDRFSQPGEWATVAELTSKLKRTAEDVSLRTRTRIATLVIDTTTPPRTR